MTNLERARNGERLKVRRLGDQVYMGANGSSWLFDEIYLENWVNQQIDYAVTHAIDETEKPELWRDLKEGEVYQEGDRVVLHNQAWVTIPVDDFFIGNKRNRRDCIAQRRVRKEDL